MPILIESDAVLNHRLGADGSEVFKAVMVDRSDRTKNVGEPQDIEGWTKFDFKARDGKYSKQTYNFNHFTGVDYDNKTGTNAIYRIEGENKYWAQNVDTENKNYDYLMVSAHQTPYGRHASLRGLRTTYNRELMVRMAACKRCAIVLITDIPVVDHAHGDVRADYLAWGAWILKETGASGFRFDAVKQ